MILTDLHKAFDTINHKILLEKRLPKGIPKKYDKLVWILLRKRHFTLEVANRALKYVNISCGVPQGAILGPLLFLVFVNDIIEMNDVTEIKKQWTENFS